MSGFREYIEGDVVPSHFNPAIVVGSYFASFSGCLLTIELLHRRGTAWGSWRSWMETLLCAIAMGVVGIWCMHFIGNRAITLDDGRDNLQLVYAPGFTALSVFLPVIGLTAAFGAAEYRSVKPLHHWIALSVTGIIAGLSIVGMHYIGNLGISNYKLVYDHTFLAAAFIIAEGDCLIVLVLFYTWREKWISSWWKRLFCASFLAGGVSAMHFTASVGCKYVFRHYADNRGRRDIQVLIAGCLCGAAVITFLIYLFFTRHRARSNRKRSKKVVLACAAFDPNGQILVHTDGTLPIREITDKYSSAGFTDEFNTSHSVLHWIFRVTYNWPGISDLVPKMKSHLTGPKGSGQDESMPTSAASSAIYDPSTYSDYSVVFRERFCVAAASLASSMNVPLDKLGVLYDKLIETGTLPTQQSSGRASRPIIKQEDVELGVRRILFGRGQVLFVVRQVDAVEAGELLNAGFRFANVGSVARAMAEALQVPVPVLETYCADLQQYIHQLENLDKPGTWLSLFAPIPKAHGGFDLAVNKHGQNQLPDVQLLNIPPQQWQREFLTALDGKTPFLCVRHLEKRIAATEDETPQATREKKFANMIILAIQALGTNVPGDWFNQSHFVATPYNAHYSHILGAHSTPTVLYNFVVMADMHVTLDAYDTIARIPMSFFNMRQRCYAGSPDHQVLARDIHAEFGPLLARKVPKPPPSSRLRMPSMVKKHKPALPSPDEYPKRQSSYTDTDTSSENGLVDKVEPVAISTTRVRDESPQPPGGRDNIWGGILVNSETTVKTDSRADFTSDGQGQGLGPRSNLGLQTAVGTAKQEDTFVDELLAVTRAKFLPPRPGY